MNQSPSDVATASPPMNLEETMAIIQPPGPRQLWSFSGPFTILSERHDVGCGCSYCKGFAAKGRAGLKLPENKDRSSWRIIWWRWKGELRLIRWTLPRAKEISPMLKAERSLRSSISAMTRGELKLAEVHKACNRVVLELQRRDGSTVTVNTTVSDILASKEGIRSYILRCVREQVPDVQHHE